MVNVLRCPKPECGCGRPRKASRRTQNDVKWGFNRWRAEGITAKGDALHLPRMCEVWHLSIRKKKEADSYDRKVCYSSKIKSPFRKKYKPL